MKSRAVALSLPLAFAFFVNSRGARLDAHNTSHTFTQLLRGAGIVVPPGVRRPRLHDLRHTFTVATLLAWYGDGGDVAARAAAAEQLPRARRPSTPILYWYLPSPATWAHPT